LDIVSAFQSYGEKMYDRITEEERQEIVRNSCPGPGACGGMYTANTMATGEACYCHHPPHYQMLMMHHINYQLLRLSG
jgi:hypothetical protein